MSGPRSRPAISRVRREQQQGKVPFAPSPSRPGEMTGIQRILRSSTASCLRTLKDIHLRCTGSGSRNKIAAGVVDGEPRPLGLRRACPEAELFAALPARAHAARTLNEGAQKPLLPCLFSLRHVPNSAGLDAVKTDRRQSAFRPQPVRKSEPTTSRVTIDRANALGCVCLGHKSQRFSKAFGCGVIDSRPESASS